MGSNPGQEPELFQEFGLFWKLREMRRIYDFLGSAITARELNENLSLGSEIIVLYIIWFVYSLLSLVVSVFPLLSY